MTGVDEVEMAVVREENKRTRSEREPSDKWCNGADRLL